MKRVGGEHDAESEGCLRSFALGSQNFHYIKRKPSASVYMSFQIPAQG
jgi:hypothetical protein